MYRILLLLLTLSFVLSTPVTAQLSDETIDGLAESHADRWATYLNLSKLRKAKLKEAWKKHEKRKSVLLRTSSDISRQLQTENQTFIAELSEFVTPNELMIYKMIENFKLEDDREYLEELVSALSNDSLFIDAYADFQYNEVLPVLITIRMELEEVISTEDKAEITSIREEIVGLYDNCLITCLANRHENTETLENLEELIIVALNKDLNNSQSGLSKLLRLTRKYEDEIHSIYIKYEPRFKHWTKKEKEIKDKYILES